MTHNDDNDTGMQQTTTAPSDRIPAPPPIAKPRGFAAMDRALVSEISRRGGKAAHMKGTAHQFTSEEATIAGRLGGKATHARRRAAKAAGGN